MKKIFLLPILTLVFCLSFNSFAYERNEKKAFEEIEALFLKEDFQAVINKGERFLREHRTSRLKRRVRQLKEIALEKLARGEEREIREEEGKVREKKVDEGMRYVVQVGVFKKHSNAAKLKKGLIKKGFDSVILKVRKGGKVFYKVRAGKFKSLENAKKLAKDLERKGYTSEIISEE